MGMMPIQERLKQLKVLNYDGKGEAFVESRFITPLLSWSTNSRNRGGDVEGARTMADVPTEASR
jgi:hypothetical protein